MCFLNSFPCHGNLLDLPNLIVPLNCPLMPDPGENATVPRCGHQETHRACGSPHAAHPPRSVPEKSQVTPNSALPDSARKPPNDPLQQGCDLRAKGPVSLSSLKEPGAFLPTACATRGSVLVSPGSAGRRTGSPDKLHRAAAHARPPSGNTDGCACFPPRLSASRVTAPITGAP